MRHLCKDTLVTLVNGQFPGPAIEATDGDTVVVHVVNESPYGITIHWYSDSLDRKLFFVFNF
jgi:laccase